MAGTFRFSFGPWNLHTGQDPFGPEVRDEFTWQEKLAMYKQMGFEGVQFHDDDAVPDLNGLSGAQISAKAKECKKQLDDNGLIAGVKWLFFESVAICFRGDAAMVEKFSVKMRKIFKTDLVCNLCYRLESFY